jgi:hypothetical protein
LSCLNERLERLYLFEVAIFCRSAADREAEAEELEIKRKRANQAETAAERAER